MRDKQIKQAKRILQQLGREAHIFAVLTPGNINKLITPVHHFKFSIENTYTAHAQNR